MTTDQVMGLLRQLLPALGGIAIALGWLTADQVNQTIQTILAIVGPLMTVGGVVWSVIANSKTSIIASATQMPEVNSDQLATAIKDPQLKKVAIENAR